jgi:hypothetical protein
MNAAIFLCWRSSSAPKKLAALFSHLVGPLELPVLLLELFIRTASLVLTPGTWPSSMSAWRTQDRSDSVPYPSCAATRWIVPCSVPSSARSVLTIRTAAAFSSGL